MTATKQISKIDQAINALRKAVPSRTERSERECDLFRQRGLLQQERDAKAHKDWLSESRKARRAKKCPTCGQATYSRIAA